MILLIGIDTDTNLRYFAHFLQKQNARFIFLNLKYLSGGINIVNRNSHFYIKMGNKSFSLEEVSGIYPRLSQPKATPSQGNLYETAQSVLLSLLEHYKEKVFNSPSANITNDSKIQQITSPPKFQIKIPPSTIISGENFQCRFPHAEKKHIFKSLSYIRSIVQPYSLQNHNTSSTEPVLLQKLIEGYNVRVHMVKNKIFCTRIDSLLTDYRYDIENRVFKEYCLPEAVAQECQRIAQFLGLKFCGIDLIHHKGNYYMLEANPSPGWLFFEKRFQSERLPHALMNALLQR